MGDAEAGSRKRGRDLDATDPFARFQGQPAYTMLHDFVKDGLIKLHDFDEGALNGLEERSPADAMRILEVFRTSNPQEKDNKSAYLCSLLKHKKRPDGRVCAAADRILQELQRSGRVRPGALDERCMDNLARLPDHVQVVAAEEFAAKDLSQARNMAALFTSLIKTVDGRSSSIPMDRGGPCGGGGGGGGYANIGSFGGGMGGPLAGGPYGPPPQHGGPGMSMTMGGGGGGGAGFGMGGTQGLPRGGGIGGPPAAADGTFGGGMAGGAAPGPMGVPGAMGTPPPAAPPKRRHWGVEQIDWGVRVDELHQVSPSAAFIHPGITKRLQDLWDEGSNLLSLLDDRSWEALTTVQPSQLQLGMLVVKETEAARVARQQVVAAGMAPPGVELDVETVNAALQKAMAERLGGAAAAAPMQRLGGGGMAAEPGGFAGRSMPDTGYSNSPVHMPLKNGGNFGGGGGGAYGVPRGPTPPQSQFGQPQPPHQPPHQPPPQGPYGGGPRGSAGGGGGGSDLQRKLQAAVASNQGKGLTMDVFDGGIMDALGQLTPQALQIALSEIASSDYATVRKPGGYIMGIIKRHRRS